jgi:electron transfer flavoprotein beta subunit
MQLAVCVAVTPSTDTRVKIAADGRSLDPTDVKFELNPYDEFALEEAIKIKEKLGTGEVIVLTISEGTAPQKEEIRKCLARGADKALLLKANPADADSSGIAACLVAEIKKLGVKAVFLGKQAVDSDSGLVPQHIAHGLDWPVVTKISKLEISGDSFTAHREIEGGVEVIEGKLPCVFSAEKGLNEPRYPTLKGIMAAKKKPLDEVTVTLAAKKAVQEKLELPAPRPEGRIIGEGKAAVDTLIQVLKQEAKVI